MSSPAPCPPNISPQVCLRVIPLIESNYAPLENPPDSWPSRCTTCQRTAYEAHLSIPLSICNTCLSASYCSRDCQAADWIVHRTACWAPIPAVWFAHSQDIGRGAAWLESLCEPACREVLVDAYRLRLYDRCRFVVDFQGAEWNPRRELREFLDRAAVQGVLPLWWKDEDSRCCITLGMEAGRVCVLNAVGKGDMAEKYGYEAVVGQLRTVADVVYGYKVKPVSGGGRLKGMGLKYVEEGGRWRLDAAGLREWVRRRGSR